MREELQAAWKSLEFLHRDDTGGKLQGVTFLRHALAFAAQKDGSDQLLLLAALFDDVNRRSISELGSLIEPKFNAAVEVQRFATQDSRRSRPQQRGVKASSLSQVQRRKCKGKGPNKKKTGDLGKGRRDTGSQHNVQDGSRTHQRRNSAKAGEEKRGNLKVFSSRNDSSFDSLSQSSFNRPSRPQGIPSPTNPWQSSSRATSLRVREVAVSIDTKLEAPGKDEDGVLFTTGVMEEEKVKVVAEDEEDDDNEDDDDEPGQGEEALLENAGRQQLSKNGEQKEASTQRLHPQTLVRRESFLRANRESLRLSRRMSRRQSRVSVQGMAIAQKTLNDDELPKDASLAQVVRNRRGSVRRTDVFSDDGSISARERTLRKLVEVIIDSSQHLELNELIRDAVDLGKILFDADRCSLYIFDRTSMELWTQFVRNAPPIHFPVTKGVLGLCACTGEIFNLHYEELQKHPMFVKAIDAESEEVGHMLCSPIFHKSGNIIGVIQIGRSRDRSKFDDFAQDLCQMWGYALQVAFENTKIYSNSVKTTNQIQSIINYLDVRKAMDSIVTCATDILKCERASLFMVDEPRQQLWARIPGNGKRDADGKVQMRRIVLPMNDKSIVGFVQQTCRLLNIRGAYKHPRFNSNIDSQTGYETRTMLTAPIRDSKGKCVAVLQALNKHNDAKFDRQDEFNVKLLASTAGVVLRNALIHDSAVYARQRMNALLGVSKMLNSEKNLTNLIGIMMKEAKRLLDVDKCTVFLLDEQTGELWSKVSEEATEIRFPATAGIAGWCVTTGMTLNIPDAYQDRRFNQDVDKKMGYYTKTILCMPIVDPKEGVLGCVQAINKKTGIFTDDDVRLLEAFAAQAEVSIINSRNHLKLLQVQKFFMSQQQTSSDKALFTFDKSGLLKFYSDPPEEVFGVDADTMVKTPYQAWIGSANEELEVILTRTYKNASNVHMQNITFHRAQDGMLFRFDCNLVPSLDAEKKVQQVYMFLGNIQMQSRKIITKALSKEDTFPPNTVVAYQDVHILHIDFKLHADHRNAFLRQILESVKSSAGFVHDLGTQHMTVLIGLPFANENDAENALSLAIKIRDIRNVFRETRLRSISSSKRLTNAVRRITHAKKSFLGGSQIQKLSQKHHCEVRIGVAKGEAKVVDDGSIYFYQLIAMHRSRAVRLSQRARFYEVVTMCDEAEHKAAGSHFITREVETVLDDTAIALPKKDVLRNLFNRALVDAVAADESGVGASPSRLESNGSGTGEAANMSGGESFGVAAAGKLSDLEITPASVRLGKGQSWNLDTITMKVFELIESKEDDVAGSTPTLKRNATLTFSIDSNPSAFAVGMDLFKEQKWEEAKEYFKKVVDGCEDVCARKYIQRCEEMLRAPLPLNKAFNGVWGSDEYHSIVMDFLTRTWEEPPSPTRGRRRISL